MGGINLKKKGIQNIVVVYSRGYTWKALKGEKKSSQYTS